MTTSTSTSAIEVLEDHLTKTMEVRVTGKLEKSDYETLVPQVEQFIEANGKVRMVVFLDDFQGWTAGALWEDIKFDVKHFNDLERLAIVGDSRWEKGMATFCTPFTCAKVRYFDRDKLVEARAWVREEAEQ